MPKVSQAVSGSGRIRTQALLLPEPTLRPWPAPSHLDYELPPQFMPHAAAREQGHTQIQLCHSFASTSSVVSRGLSLHTSQEPARPPQASGPLPSLLPLLAACQLHRITIPHTAVTFAPTFILWAWNSLSLLFSLSNSYSFLESSSGIPSATLIPPTWTGTCPLVSRNSPA